MKRLKLIFPVSIIGIFVLMSVTPGLAGSSFESALGAHVRTSHATPTNSYGQKLLISFAVRAGGIDSNGNILSTQGGSFPIRIMTEVQSDPSYDYQDKGSALWGAYKWDIHYQMKIDKIRIEMTGIRPTASGGTENIDGADLQNNDDFYIVDLNSGNSNLASDMDWLFDKAVDYGSGKVPYGLGPVVKYVYQLTKNENEYSGEPSGNTGYWQYDYGTRAIPGQGLVSKAGTSASVKINQDSFLGEFDGRYSLRFKLVVGTVLEKYSWTTLSSASSIVEDYETYTYYYYINLDRNYSPPPPPPTCLPGKPC